MKAKKETSITRKQVKRVQRKEWGNINPRKSIGKKREASKEGRAKGGLRINRAAKKENEDPILALLNSEA